MLLLLPLRDKPAGMDTETNRDPGVSVPNSVTLADYYYYYYYYTFVDFYVNTSLSTTNVPESQNARICVQRSGRTVRNYTLNLQPSTIPGGAQSK